MIVREAFIQDIPQMQVVRNSVWENRLSDPSVISDSDYLPFIEQYGKGWVCLHDNEVIGFAFVDFLNSNIWALFVKPEFEKKGVGSKLHDQMLDWYFSNYTTPLWLSTAPVTRAERFYESKGWIRNGFYGKGEVKFEMSIDRWKKISEGAS